MRDLVRVLACMGRLLAELDPPGPLVARFEVNRASTGTWYVALETRLLVATSELELTEPSRPRRCAA